MTRRIRTVVVITVALVMATAASYAVYGAVTRMPVREVEVAHRYIVVAAESLPIGTRITRDHVKLVAWPKSSAIPGTFESIDAIVGRGLTSSVLENEPISEARIAPTGSGAGLPPAIPPGMRAISVKVDEVVGVAGFVVPGTHVDVIVTIGARGLHEQSSRVVVSNVTVLTAGTRYDQEAAKDGKPIRSTVVTLLVKPEDAEKVALAESEGEILLTLRNPLDTGEVKTNGIRLGALIGQSAPVTIQRAVTTAPVRREGPPPAPPAAIAKPVYTVEAIKAAKRTQEAVR
jgi:pilus assembly protein CpaB